MGQEILYCNQCGTRLIGEDFTRGRAHTFHNRQYCTACVPQTLGSAPAPTKKESRPVDRSPATSQGRLKGGKLAAAPTPAPSSSTTLLLVGLACIAAIVVVLYVIRSSGRVDPAPEPAVAATPKPEPPKPAPPAVSKEKIAKDLQDLEAKIQPTIKNEQFSATLGRVLGRPSWLRAPKAGLRLLLGEIADVALANGQRVVPARALGAGFGFKFIDVESALRSAIS